MLMTDTSRATVDQIIAVAALAIHEGDSHELQREFGKLHGEPDHRALAMSYNFCAADRSAFRPPTRPSSSERAR